MKFRVFMIMILLFGLVFAGCSQENQEGTESTGNESSDVVTTASIVNDGEALAYALGENGKFITATLQDMTLDKDLVVVGNTHNKDDAAQPLYRKLALYTQDEDHKIIDSFTLTVPKLIVKSENFKIQGGTLKGDVYVEANGFSLHETATVDGNIYFANEEFKASAVFDGKVTGKTEITKPDVVTTASIVNDGEALAYALGESGKFITATLQDLTLDKELVVVGNTHNKDDAAQPLYRKLALYTQDADHKIIDSFTLTVPKLIVKSENFKIQGGTLKGDVYVEANGFSLHETATVDGNIYFANEEFKSSAVFDGKVTGKTEIGTKPDVVTTASIVNDGESLAYSLGENGKFITATLQDLTLDKDLVVVGNTHNKNDTAQPLYRKLALYTQDADHKIIDSFTLTVPKLIVKSENFKIQGGTLKGDVYVEANGFTLHETATVDGNIYFANEEYKASAVFDGTVTGSKEVK